MPLSRTQSKHGTRPVLILMLFFAVARLPLGCHQQPGESSDPQLKPIQEMIDQQLPVGTTDASVQSFLSARGYTIETPDKPGTLVATIRHIDAQTVLPVTARVTFYFDANGKLNTYEMHRVFNQRIP